MEQLASAVLGLLGMVTVLVVLGTAALTMGVDSRPTVGDTHRDGGRADWI